jgi:hypothetical protein
LLLIAAIVGLIWIFSLETITTVKNALSERLKEYQTHNEKANAESEANRTLKTSAAALEAELTTINTQGTVEAVRQDIMIVKQRAGSLQERFLNIQDKAERVYGNRTDRDGSLYAQLKSYGPTQIEMLDRYLDLLDKADKGVLSSKDASEFVPLLRKMQRTVREEFVKQHLTGILVSRLERQFNR